MADYTKNTKRIILFLLLWIYELKSISASAPIPYCEFDLCDETEYCCKQNVCCTKPNGNIVIIIWILDGLIILGIALAVLYKCKNRLYRFFSRGSESEFLTSSA